MPKYPGITVKLTGKDGNAFAILGAVRQAMKNAEIPKEDIDAFFNEATEGDYGHLLRTCMKYIFVE